MTTRARESAVHGARGASIALAFAGAAILAASSARGDDKGAAHRRQRDADASKSDDSAGQRDLQTDSPIGSSSGGAPRETQDPARPGTRKTSPGRPGASEYEPPEDELSRGATPAPGDSSGRVWRAIRVTGRAGVAFHNDSGLVDHAQAFNFPLETTAWGGGIEAGFEVLPRLSLFCSFSTGTSAAKRGDATLSVSTKAFLAHARYAIWRSVLDDGATPALGLIELTAGGGRYSLSQELEEPSLYSTSFKQTSHAIGMRAGVDASVYLGFLGLVAGYAYNYSSAVVRDRLGGGASAGGHEITLGLSLRI